ncbi:MAG: uracil-DNA glycosylase [Chloroflexota bacterium]
MSQLSLFSDAPTYQSLEDVKQDCLCCRSCRLHQTRDKVVFGAGNPQAAVMVIGQGPSKSDNGTGIPYSGPSGSVLDKGLEKVGLSRDVIWLTNIHKCLSYDLQNRKLRTPKADELKACHTWLEAEIHLVSPKVIVCLGGPAAQKVISPKFKLNEERGQWRTSQIGGIKTLATFQPAYLMRLKEWDRPKAVAGWHTFIADLETAVQAL